MPYLVRTVPRAERDLESIFLYINGPRSEAAARWFDRLIEAIHSLAYHPQRNPVTHEDDSLRHLLFGSKPHIYRVIYFIDVFNQRVDVVHVRHHSRAAFGREIFE